MARRRQEREQRTAQELAQRQQAALNAEDVAKQYWQAAAKEGTSAYAQRKGIDAPESCRYLPTEQGGGLVIPMIRYDLDRAQALKGVQIIKDDGTKKFTYGMSKPGTACRLGLAVVGEPVFVCEGYATGMTIRMALERRHPVFVAFDAYNLPSVVTAIHQALPGSPIVICADDQQRGPHSGPDRAGQRDGPWGQAGGSHFPKFPKRNEPWRQRHRLQRPAQVGGFGRGQGGHGLSP